MAVHLFVSVVHMACYRHYKDHSELPSTEQNPIQYLSRLFGG